MGRRALLIGAGAVAVLVAAGIGVVIANSARTPEAAARGYLTAIVEGRAEAANELADPALPDERRVLLTDDALGAADERISDVSAELEQIDRTGRAYVDVSYRLGEDRYEKRISLVKGQPDWLVLDRWEVQESLVEPVDLGVYGPGDITIGGQEIVLARNGVYGRAKVALYPGVYTVTPIQTRYLAAEPVTVRVSEKGVPTTDVEFSPTAQLESTAASAIDALLARCVDAADDGAPAGCPFRSETRPDGTAVTWEIAGAPRTRVVDWGWRVESRGQATATYTDASGAVYDRRESRFVVVGDIAIDGDEVTVGVGRAAG